MFGLWIDPDTLEERGEANVTKKMDVGGKEVRLLGATAALQQSCP